MQSRTSSLITTEVIWRKIAKYFAIFKIGSENQAVDKGDMISLGVLVAIRVVLLTQLYRAVYLNETAIEGLTISMTMWSITVAHSMQLSSGTRQIILGLRDEIRTGNIAHTLSKPYSFLLYLYTVFLGRFWTRLASGLALGLLTAFVLAGPIHLTFSAVVASIILAFFGITLNSVITMIIGICAFWTEEVTAFRWVYDKIQWTFSGMMIPLAFFPDTLKTVVEYSPFAVLFYAPGRILVGFEPGLFIKYLGLQIFWLVIFTILLAIIYRKGQNNVSINGG